MWGNQSGFTQRVQGATGYGAPQRRSGDFGGFNPAGHQVPGLGLGFASPGAGMPPHELPRPGYDRPIGFGDARPVPGGVGGWQQPAISIPRYGQPGGGPPPGGVMPPVPNGLPQAPQGPPSIVPPWAQNQPAPVRPNAPGTQNPYLPPWARGGFGG